VKKFFSRQSKATKGTELIRQYNQQKNQKKFLFSGKMPGSAT
jgi:hypothetical protein